MSIAEINAEFKKYDATFKVVDNGLDHIETGQCENPQEVCFKWYSWYYLKITLMSKMTPPQSQNLSFSLFYHF